MTLIILLLTIVVIQWEKKFSRLKCLVWFSFPSSIILFTRDGLRSILNGLSKSSHFFYVCDCLMHFILIFLLSFRSVETYSHVFSQYFFYSFIHTCSHTVRDLIYQLNLICLFLFFFGAAKNSGLYDDYDDKYENA